MGATLRVMVACAEFAGNVYPGIALARALRTRGNEVLVQTCGRWRDAVEEMGLRCATSEELVPPLDEAWVQWAVGSAQSLIPVIEDFRPDVVVSDIVAATPPLAAEAAGVKRATLMPHVYPLHSPGLPAFPLGLLPARTPLGRAAWRALDPAIKAVIPYTRWLRRVPALLNAARAELGLAPIRRPHGEISSYGHSVSEGLAMVATFPQLEYPRHWPPHIHVTGPMLLERPHSEVELPRGEEPLVLVAASTLQDPEALVRTSIEALAEEPVRVLATMSRRGEPWSGEISENAVVVDWVSYAQVMPRASMVVCAGGHGTVVRALSDGVPVLVSPGGGHRVGDLAVNGARVTWTGAGLMLPGRLLGPSTLRWAVRRVLTEQRFAASASAIAAWHRENDGAERGAELVERYGRG
jgi:UDP:flavonoid glycosyltransferase YjiC (YdhE family)